MTLTILKMRYPFEDTQDIVRFLNEHAHPTHGTSDSALHIDMLHTQDCDSLQGTRLH